MDQEDVATEILSLYKALRDTRDEALQEAMKNRIDELIEESHRALRPQPLGVVHFRPQKLDA